MLLKDRLRKFNRKLRAAPIYDYLYLKARTIVIGGGPDKVVRYYHDHYTHPIVPGRVLLDAFWGRMIGCNPYALYLKMRADPRCVGFHYIWVCNDASFIPSEMRDDPAVSFVIYQSEPFQEALLTSQYLIGNSNLPRHFVKKPDQVFINVWHGTPIKKLGLHADERLISSANTQRNYLFSDYILSSSVIMTDRTVRAYGAQAALERVYEVGTPRIDLTLATSRECARDMLGVTQSKDVLLYAPTWRGSFHDKNTNLAAQIDIIEDIITQFSQTHEVFVSVHHIMAAALKAGDVAFRTVPPHVPINVLLAGVDVLLTDYSSIMIDYLSLNRPIALLCHDHDSFSTTQGLHDDLKDLPMAFCTTVQELQRAVQDARKPSSFASYTKYKALFLDHEDGVVSGRCLDTILAQTPKAAYPAAPRTRIVIYAGGFASNGITSSIVALSHAIDHAQYEVTIVVNATLIDKDTTRRRNLNKLSAQCRLVTRCGAMVGTSAEIEAYAWFRQNGVYQSPSDQALIDEMFMREVRRVCGDQSYDVAINFSGYNVFWTLMMCHVSADRRLIYQHADMHLEAYNPDSTRSFPELPSVFALYQRYDGIVSVTPEMLAVNRANLGQYYTKQMQFHAVQNVISNEMIQTQADIPLAQVSPQVAALAHNKELYLFCCVARLSAEKNHMLLLDAFAKAHKSAPDCALIILGGGKLLRPLQRHAQRLGILEHVLFLGHQDNPYAVMKACDCKVLSSNYEGQGIVLLEALTLGLKCIATDNPAIRNVLGGGLGTIVPQDTDALSHAMVLAVQAGKTRQPPFDADRYAACALQQFYHSLRP